MYKQEPLPENEMHEILYDFGIQTDHLTPVKKKKKKKEKRSYCIVDFSIPANHRIKIKESEKRDKYLNLAREIRKSWNMRATVIPVVISVLDKVPKGLERELEELEIVGRIEAIQTTALSRLAKIMRRVLETYFPS